MGGFEYYLKQQKPGGCKNALRGYFSKSEPHKLYLGLSATKLVPGAPIQLPFLRCSDKPLFEGINPHTSSSTCYGGSGFRFVELSQQRPGGIS